MFFMFTIKMLRNRSQFLNNFLKEQGRKRPLDKPKRMIERRERERLKERYIERWRER